MTPPADPTSVPRVLLLVSADSAWRAVRDLHAEHPVATPFGETLQTTIATGGEPEPIRIMQGGWGKIAAAAATQYAIDRWRPELLVNIGTCGGFRGEIERGEVILVERTIVYDMHVEIGDPQAELDHYTTAIDLAWLGEASIPGTRRGTILTGDRDIIARDVPHLVKTYGALGADWESGSVAYVARRNGARCVILRGVSDLVGADGGDAYGGNDHIYESGSDAIITVMLRAIPMWIRAARQ